MDRIITIDDIARAAGVGKGTVDRVLHSRGRVSAETRARVLRCIEQLDYRPNKTARMLAKTRDYRIAVCFHDKEAEFWQQIRCGVDKASLFPYVTQNGPLPRKTFSMGEAKSKRYYLEARKIVC